MQILIVENESYLAQSICAKLSQEGYVCDIASTPKDAIKDKAFDVVLLSTSIINQNFKNVLKHYRKNSTIILLNSYVTNDTVARPIEYGACDYILKPFTMKELIRKINHHVEFNRLKKSYLLNNKYINFLFSSIDIDKDLYCKKLPIFVKSNIQSVGSCFAFRYAKTNNYDLIFVNLLDDNMPKNISDKELVLAINFHKIKKADKKAILNTKYKNVIISTVGQKDKNIQGFSNIVLNNETDVLENTPILSIEEYIKCFILKYQDHYPDIEISRKLGICRKNLWEKRKRFKLFKQVIKTRN